MAQRNLDERVSRDHFASTAFVLSLILFATMRPLRSLLLALVIVAAAACANPRAEASVAQALNDAAIEINGLKSDVAQLQTQIDSLHQIVMKQDSTIARIAAVNNIPISR